ncbi:hypothetical protein [Hymenobacter sp. BT491]|uniref:hypothetical protein n=1 Tax=Hymenobacter sp. BT491 TaxID=2766779 RepID=UPI0016535EE2|nr:hypothetical protein [Hymenobacter sp. BT491]MBC6988578.1 hypothetical protein [Hymenobacter sp. BT491]
MATDKDKREVEIIIKGQQATSSIKEMGAAAAVMKAQLDKMSQDDPRREKLQRDYAEMTVRLREANVAARTLVKTTEELAAEQAESNAEALRIVVNGKKVSATYNEMDAAAKQLEKDIKDLTPGTQEFITKSKDLQQVKGRLEEVTNEMGNATQKTSALKQAMAVVGVALTAEAAVEGIKAIGSEIYNTTAKFETYAAVLKTALGSESAAQLALHDIQTMAAQTPFSVDELTASFIKFVNRGLNPSMADMSKLADLAASQGKSFEQLTEAVLDAGTGEFERLKEFGVQASKSGDQVTLSFKGTQQVVANTPEAINAALLSFGELNGVMGSTAAISETLAGQQSNLGDTADQVAITYGQVLRPAFVAVFSTIGFLLGVLKALPGFLSENRGVIIALAGAVLTFNASMVQSNALLLYNAAVAKGKVVWDTAVTVSTKAWEMAQRGLNLALAANPIGAVIAVATLLIGVFVALYDKSEKVRAVVAGLGSGFMALVTTLKNGVVQQLTGLGDLLVGIFTLNPEKIKQGLASIGGSIKTIYVDAGRNAAAAFNQGYDARMASEAAARAGRPADAKAEAEAARKKAEAAAKARAEAEAKAHLEGLKTEEANLKVRLAQVEDGSRQEMKLKQQLISVQAKIEVEDGKKTENDKRVIRAEALDKMQDLEREFNKKQAKEREENHKKLEKAAEEASKKELALQHSIEDLQVASIKDKHEREIQEINLQTNRKMAALQGDDEQIMAQWELLEQQRQEKIAAVRLKQKEEADKLKEEELQKQVEQEQADEEAQAAQIELAFANGLMAEQQYQDALFNLKQVALANQLALVKQMKGEESAEYKRISNQILANEAARIKKEKEQKQELRTFDMNTQKLGAQLLAEGLALVEDNLNKKSAAYQVFKAVRKAAELAEIGIGLQAELQANSLNAARNPLNAVPGGAALVATQLAIQNGMSIVRAVAAGIKVAAFKEGGNTGQAKNIIDGRQMLSLLSGASGGSQAPSGSFVGGGPVGKATIGLIGEAGPELVIPNWMYADPKQADLMGFLEAQIASKGNAFAAGGATVAGYSAANGASSADNSIPDLLSQMVRVLGNLDSRLEGVEDWQRNLEVHNDLFTVKRGLEVIDQTQKSGGIR